MERHVESGRQYGEGHPKETPANSQETPEPKKAHEGEWVFDAAKEAGVSPRIMYQTVLEQVDNSLIRVANRWMGSPHLPLPSFCNSFFRVAMPLR